MPYVVLMDDSSILTSVAKDRKGNYLFKWAHNDVYLHDPIDPEKAEVFKRKDEAMQVAIVAASHYPVAMVKVYRVQPKTMLEIVE